MTRETSIYLDATRFTAAISVLFYHFFSLGFTDSMIRFPYGREAVMIFFVISGFVIAFVADTREDTWQTYSISRYARLYSVVVPALILTFIIDTIGAEFDPSAYDPNTHDLQFLRIGASLLFINQIWNFTITPLSNGPFWSLSYEFSYYLIFGAAMFAPGRWRYILTAIVLVAAGPRIALYFPIWLIGVLVYHIQKRMHAPKSITIAMFCISSIFFFMFLGVEGPLDNISRMFRGILDANQKLDILGVNVFIGGNWRFPSDFMLALAFSGTLLFSDVVGLILLRNAWIARTIRFFASHTFSIYLYHVPLLIFFDILLDRVILPEREQNSILNGAMLLFMTGASIMILGRYTENRKGIYVAVFRKINNYIFSCTKSQ